MTLRRRRGGNARPDKGRKKPVRIRPCGIYDMASAYDDGHGDGYASGWMSGWKQGYESGQEAAKYECVEAVGKVRR